jgi:hypothetical protein
MKKNETVFDRYVAAYFRHCKQYQETNPGIHSIPQPSCYDSDWLNKDTFVLRNCNGVLASYKCTGDEVDGFSVSRIK